MQRVITIAIILLICLFFFGWFIIDDPIWFPLQISFYFAAKFLSKFKDKRSFLYDDFFETSWRIFVAIILVIGFALTFILGLQGTIYEDILTGLFLIFFLYALVVYLMKKRKR